VNEPSQPSESAGRRKAPDMYDVARLAGVSQKTVSRVVNNERYVSDASREKVLRAARELGFRPNTAARALTTGRFQRIGVVSLSTAGWGPASLLVALERGVREAGFSFSVAHTMEGEPQSMQDGIDRLLEQGVDGIILSEPIDEPQGRQFEADVPIVSLGYTDGLPPESVVPTDAHVVADGREATNHLLDLGHAKVWHIAGPQNWWAARERLEGWRQAHLDRGIEPPPHIEGDWSPASGYEIGKQLAVDPEVTAVFCTNDDTATGLILALTEAGLRVPEDVSVVGFDDIPAAAYLRPPLTTVRQTFEADANQAIAALLSRITGAPAFDLEGSDGDGSDRPLIIRASTAPPWRRRGAPLSERPGAPIERTDS
jgi:DNA-binding LacI/PurR family transcriptional regulator